MDWVDCCAVVLELLECWLGGLDVAHFFVDGFYYIWV